MAYLVVLVEFQGSVGVKVADLKVSHRFFHADPILPILCPEKVGLHTEIGQALWRGKIFIWSCLFLTKHIASACLVNKYQLHYSIMSCSSRSYLQPFLREPRAEVIQPGLPSRHLRVILAVDRPRHNRQMTSKLVCFLYSLLRALF